MIRRSASPGSWLRPEDGQRQEDEGDEDKGYQPPPTEETAAAAALLFTAVVFFLSLFQHGRPLLGRYEDKKM